MNQLNPERKSSPGSRETDTLTFADKFRELLPGVESGESTEMREARAAVLEALTTSGQDPGFLRSVWIEYAGVCEQAVDSVPDDTDPQTRAQLQVAALVHKALVFREAGDTQRYSEELIDAEGYALNARLDEMAEAIGTELDTLV